MPPIDRLVVLGSTLTALALARAAGRRRLTVALVDRRNGIAAESRFAHLQLVSDDDEALSRLASLASLGPTALVADNDDWLRFIIRHRQALQRSFQAILHPDNVTLETFLDKSRFLDWCVERNFPVPRRYDAPSEGKPLEQHHFPLLLRPEQTRHGRGLDVPKAIEVLDNTQLQYWLNRYASASVPVSIAQSLLRPGIRQYSVGFARDDTGRMRSVVAEKLRSLPRQCAGGTFVVETRQDEVADLVRRLANGSGYVGIGEAEVMRDDATGDIFLIEVNARPWVQYLISERAGLDFLGFLLGGELAVEQPSTRRPVRWLNFEADLFCCWSREGGAIRAGEIGWRAYLYSLAESNAFAVWDSGDPRPFVRQTGRLLAGRLGRR